MALVDPYSPCPCGSDKKFKWCCQKAEPYVERSNRLAENGQYDAAIAALDEGLLKVPDNPWLLLRKALLLVVQQQPEAAAATVETVLRRQPDHLGAAVLQTRFALANEGPVAAAAALQHALSSTKPETHARLAKIVALVAEELGKHQIFPAALKHFELALKLDSSENSPGRSALRSLKTNPLISPWLKQPYALAESPERLGGPQREQFERALGWAQEGLWGSAAAAFDLLSADPVAGPAADRNLGLCRLWLGDHAAAGAALRRWIDRAGPTTEAVDLAVVCQSIDESTDKEPIEHVRLSWPLRDRAALLKALEGEATIVKGEDRHLDPDDEESPEVHCFHWLDRPSVEPRHRFEPARGPACPGGHPGGHRDRDAGDRRRRPAQRADRSVHRHGRQGRAPGPPADEGCRPERPLRARALVALVPSPRASRRREEAARSASRPHT